MAAQPVVGILIPIWPRDILMYSVENFTLVTVMDPCYLIHARMHGSREDPRGAGMESEDAHGEWSNTNFSSRWTITHLVVVLLFPPGNSSSSVSPSRYLPTLMQLVPSTSRGRDSNERVMLRCV